MQPNKRQAIIDKLTYIASHTAPGSTLRQTPKPNRLLGGLDGSAYVLSGEAYHQYDKVIDLFLGEPTWNLKFSHTHIEKNVHDLLNLLVRDGNTDKVADYVDEFIAEAEAYSKKHVVYLPIDGIQLLVDRVRLGPLVIVNMSGSEFADIQTRATDLLAKRSTSPEDYAERLKAWEEILFSVLRDRAVVVYEATAESTRAQERAEEEWRNVVDVVRYFIFIAFQKRVDIAIGLRGDVRYGIGQAVACTPDFEELHSTSTSKSPQGLVVDANVVKAMESAGVFALADMLEPQGKTSFSDTLLRGVHWVADALTQVEPANEFLSLVSCLETFLTREVGDATSISNAVAVGVAWVLGKDKDERADLRKRIKKLYDKRSTVSHGGKQEELAKDLPWLRDVVRAFVAKMIERRDEFKKTGKAGLHQWIEEGPIRG